MAPSRDPPILNNIASGDPDLDLAERLHVERHNGDFASYAVSKVDLPAGALFARITNVTPGKKAYSSVQISESAHIELNSDLLYCNHSCHPSMVFDMSKYEVRVHEGRDLKTGDKLTFFYPSTEWDMAQPFDCECKTEQCLGTIDGAGNMEESVLRGFWLNEHIERMLDGRNAKVDGNVIANGKH